MTRPPIQILGREDLHARLSENTQAAVADQLGVKVWELRKHRISAGVPLPPAGYWLKRQAGESVDPIALPVRPPGAAAIVTLGYYATLWRRRSEMLSDPIPPEPSFPTPVQEMVRQAMGRVTVPLDAPSTTRRPAKERRTRLVRTLREALAQVYGELEVNRAGPAKMLARVGAIQIAMALEPVDSTGRSSAAEELRLRVGIGEGAREFFDEVDHPLERQLREILATLMTAAELRYRTIAEEHYRWCRERRSEAEQDARERRRRALRLLADRRKAWLERRRQRLHGQADDWRLARDIRGLVTEVLREAKARGQARKVGAWARWARLEADAVDPLLNGELDFDEDA